MSGGGGRQKHAFSRPPSKKAKFASTLDPDRLRAKLGLGAAHFVTRPKSHDIG